MTTRWMMNRLKMSVLLLVLSVFVQGCALIPCSSKRPCDARPRAYREAEKRERKAERQLWRDLRRDGVLYAFYVGGNYPVRTAVMKDGKLVPTPPAPPPPPIESGTLEMQPATMVSGVHNFPDAYYHQISFDPQWATWDARCVAVDLYAGNDLAWSAQAAAMRDRYKFCESDHEGVILGDKYVSRRTWLLIPAAIVDAHPGAAWRLVVRAVDDDRQSVVTGVYSVTLGNGGTR